MRRPEQVRVGPHDYRIDYVDLSDKSLMGECTGHELRIAIDETLAGSMLADTLVHEFLHAIWLNAGLSERAAEENAVAALATGWCGVLRDNPALARFIASELSASRDATLETPTQSDPRHDRSAP